MVPITANACSNNLYLTMRTNVRMLLAGFICLIVVGCSGPECGNVILKESISPNGKKVALLFERNCGATTPFVQVVIIRDNGSDFDGNNTEDFIFTMKGQQLIEIQWENAKRLAIIRPLDKNNIFKEQKSWEGIEISYRNP